MKPTQTVLEAARLACDRGEIGQNQLTAIEQILRTEDLLELMLACRLLGGGADPASLSYLDSGFVPKKIMLAHVAGPSVYQKGDPERDTYLTLCSLSEDEAADTTLRNRVLTFAEALVRLGTLGPDAAPWDQAELTLAGREKLQDYLDLPYATFQLDDDPELRVYVSDGGHAAAVWDEGDPQTASAVYGLYNGEPYLSLGAPASAETLEEQGYRPSRATKQLSERFWIYEDESVLEAARAGLAEAGILYPVPAS